MASLRETITLPKGCLGDDGQIHLATTKPKAVYCGSLTPHSKANQPMNAKYEYGESRHLGHRRFVLDPTQLAQAD